MCVISGGRGGRVGCGGIHDGMSGCGRLGDVGGYVGELGGGGGVGHGGGVGGDGWGCVVAHGEEGFGSVGCVDGLVLGLVGEVWMRWSEWVSVREVVLGMAGCMIVGGRGTHRGLGGAGLGMGVSGCGCPLPVFAGWRLWGR